MSGFRLSEGLSGTRSDPQNAPPYLFDRLERLFPAEQTRFGAYERFELAQGVESFIVRHPFRIQTEHDVHHLFGHAERDADNPEMVDHELSFRVPDLFGIPFDPARNPMPPREETANSTFEALNERIHGVLLSEVFSMVQ
jgi:hypothetical protein